eukprot:XP_017946197.1 PREDICTED: nucleolar protein 12-like [Xenopus tropicalis]
MGKKKQKKGSTSCRELTFDEEKRREYLTGFHKRKMQRRKAAVEEIKRKIKEEQKKMREERHKEYMKMLKEREEALCELGEYSYTYLLCALLNCIVNCNSLCSFMCRTFNPFCKSVSINFILKMCIFG